MAGIFEIRAYCSKCHKLLMTSPRFTKKDLLRVWDSAVIGAASIICKDCDTKAPNFNINLKIYNSRTCKEYEPKVIIPKPKNPITEIEEISNSLKGLNNDKGTTN